MSGRALRATLHQPRDLLPRVPADALQEAQHYGLLNSLQSGISEATHGTGDEAVALFGGHRKTDRCGSVQKGL
jgi:hypothetical protein